MAVSRRALGKLMAAGLLAPRVVLAGGSGHQFLFVFCRGGWDPAWAFTPELLGSRVYTDPEGSYAEAGGIPYIQNASRSGLQPLLERFGSRCCLINGLEIRSITHDACRRIVFTGGTDAATDDWAARIGGESPGYPLASLVVSGPSYTSRYTSAVARVGPDGQLGKLLTGDALDQLTAPPAARLSEAAAGHVEDFLARRAAASADAAGRGRAAAFVADQQQALQQAAMLRAAGDLGLSGGGGSPGPPTLLDRTLPAIESLELGLSRCAVVEHNGQYDATWDSHSGAALQGDHFSVLGDDLLQILGELDGRGMLDNITVAVFSEMGRAPQLNLTGGKDHWTFTSAMLFGAGVCGGQVIGGFDEGMIGLPVDLATGAADPSGGVTLTAAHLGATLLHLAGVDGDGVPPISAALC